MAKFCGKCGARAEDNEMFCSGCGASFEDAQEQASAFQSVNAVPVQEEQPQPVSYDQQAGTYDQQAGAYDQSADVSYGAYDQNAAQANFADMNGGAAVKKGSKNMVPVIVCAAVLVVLIAAFVIISLLTRYVKVDAQQLIDVDFVGPDGYGKCYVQFNVDPEFAQKEYDVYDFVDYSVVYGTKTKKEIEYSDYLAKKGSKLEDAYGKDKDKAEEMRDAILSTTKASDGKIFEYEITASKDSGLKNGDKVTITIDVDEDELKESGLKLENTTFEVEVKGLSKSTTIDPFENLEVTFDGIDGQGSASLSTYSNDFAYFEFESYYYDLSNGDTVVVEARLDYDYYDYDLAYLDEDKPEEGYWFTRDSKVYVWPYEKTTVTKEFTVEGLQGLEEIDPFDGMTFSTSGATPFLQIDSANFAEDSILNECAYASIDQDYGTRYKIGDTFTVKVYAYYELAERGYKLAGTPDSDGYVTKEFTVEDGIYPAYADESTAPQAAADLAEVFSASVTDYKQNYKGTSYLSNVDLESSIKSFAAFDEVDTYLAFNEATSYDNIGWSEDVNTVIRLYKATVKTKKGNQSFYVILTLSDVTNDSEDGKFVSSNSVQWTQFEDKAEAMEYIEDREGYSVTKIGDTGSSSNTDASSDVDTSSADEGTDASSDTDTSSADESSEASADSKADDSSEIVP